MIFGALCRWVEEHPARAGTLAGWFQQGCGVVAALVVVPLVIKVLSKGDAGLWFCFQNVLAILNLTDFGLSFVVTRQVSYSMHIRPGAAQPPSDFISTREGWLGVSDIYRVGCALFRRVGLIALVVLILLYHTILPLGKLLTHATSQTCVAWYLLGASTLLSLQGKPHVAVVEGLGKLYLTRLLLGTTQLLTGLGVILVLSLGGHLVEMASAVSAVSLLQYLGARYLVRRVTGLGLERRSELPPGLSRQFFKVAVRMGILNLSSFLVSSIQVPVLGFLLGPNVVPGFFLAQRIGQMLNQGVMQIVTSQMPMFTRDIALEARQPAQRRLKRTVGIVTALAVLGNALLYFGSPVFVEFWVGPGRFVDPVTLGILSVDFCILTAAMVWGQFVLAAGSNPFVWSTVASGILNLSLIWILVPRYSVTGAALASLLTGLLINYWYVIHRGICCLQGLRFPAAANKSILQFRSL